MLRSLYLGVSGLQSHQTLMDVLSNNISNVNTVGFKKAQVTFQDMLSQTIAAASAGSTGDGGTNEKQIGSGVKVASINNLVTQGSTYSTGNSTDLMIQGEGYFVVKDGSNTFYTRAGSFAFDSAGNLVNASGMILCDTTGNAIKIADYSGDISIASDGTITYTDTSGASKSYAKPIALVTFPNAAGLSKAGDSLYTESPASGNASSLAEPGKSGTGRLISGALEMSNVDLSQEFVNMIIAQRGFQANSKSIQTSDEILQEMMNLKR